MRYFYNIAERLARGHTLFLPCCAKVNIFLDITGKRDDGYHFIMSLFVPVSLFDVLRVRLIKGNRIVIRCSEDWFDPEKNTLKKAFDLFSSKTGFGPGMSLRLIKNIPAGSGLGGASSDAAVLLNMLNALMKLQTGRSLTVERLISLSSQVGADVPFFIRCRPALVEGIGEIIRIVRLKGDIFMVIIVPDVPFYTGDMYKEYDRLNRLTKGRKGDKHLPPFLGYRYIVGSVFNVFETVIRGSKRRLVMRLKKSLIDYGAESAALSGSGSAVFGLFRNARDACFASYRLSKDFGNYRVFAVKVLRDGRVQ